MYKSKNALFALLFLTVANFSFAQDEASSAASEEALPATAHATVEQVTEQLLGMLEDSKKKFEQDPDQFYADIDAVISPWVDFGYWSKQVIYRDYWADTSEEQRQRFEQVFRSSLIETYAKGMLSVEDTGFKIDPPHPGDEEKASVNVKQTLSAGADRVEVLYTMSKNDAGRWQFRNVTLEGINLGGMFRNQFRRAAEDYNRDYDKVIDNWSPEA